MEPEENGDERQEEEPGDDSGAGGAPTLDQVYAAIMNQKRKAQEEPSVTFDDPQTEEPIRFRSGLGASLRNGTLEQLLLQGLVGSSLAGPDSDGLGTRNASLGLGGSGQVGGSDRAATPLQALRSNAIENILRDTLSGGKDLEDLVLDWNQVTAPSEQQKLLEGLHNDMQAIEAAPPDVAAMRRTFTLERILSGAETDLVGMLRGGGGGGLAGGLGDEDGVGRPGGRGRLEGQDSLHRLAAASGPGGQGPRPSPLGSAGQAARGGAGGGGAAGLSMGRPGSGRYGAAAALLAEEEGLQRSPKRSKLSHASGHTPSKLGAHGEVLLGAAGAPLRTVSQSLLDLAAAAAELDRQDGAMDAEGGEGRAGEADSGGCAEEQADGAAAGGAGGEEQAGGASKAEVEGQEGSRAEEPGAGGDAGAEAEAGQRLSGGGAGGGGDAPGADAGEPCVKQEPGTAVAGPEGQEAGRDKAASREQVPVKMEGGVPEARKEGERAQGAGQGQAGPLGGDPLLGGAGGAGLLRSGSGLRGGPAAGPLGGGGLRPAGLSGAMAGAGGQMLSAQEQLVLRTLHEEVGHLQRENDILNGHLEAVLAQVDLVQQANNGMKHTLLQACHAKGIQADLSLLNMSLQHHRAQPMPEGQAVQVAATVLGLNGGDVLATVQQLIGIALLRIADSR